MSQMEAVPDIVNEPVASYGLTAETLYEKCIALARNLWWSWNPEVINLFRDLDPIRWRQLDHNPIALLSEFTAERWRCGRPSWCSSAASTRPIAA